MTVGYKLLHIAEKECQQYCPYVRTVLVCIGEYYYLVVLEAAYIEILAYACTKGGYYGAELLVCYYLIQPLFLHIQRLAPKRQYALKPPVPALLGAAACGVSLHDKQLVYLCVAARTARQLAHQRRVFQLAFFPGHSLGLAGSFTNLCGFCRLFGYLISRIGILKVIEVRRKVLCQHVFYGRPSFRISQLCLCLPLELHAVHLE